MDKNQMTQITDEDKYPSAILDLTNLINFTDLSC